VFQKFSSAALKRLKSPSSISNIAKSAHQLAANSEPLFRQKTSQIFLKRFKINQKRLSHIFYQENQLPEAIQFQEDILPVPSKQLVRDGRRILRARGKNRRL